MLEQTVTYTCPRCYSPICRSEAMDHNALALATYPDSKALADEAAARANEEAKACNARRAALGIVDPVEK